MQWDSYSLHVRIYVCYKKKIWFGVFWVMSNTDITITYCSKGKIERASDGIKNEPKFKHIDLATMTFATIHHFSSSHQYIQQESTWQRIKTAHSR